MGRSSILLVFLLLALSLSHLAQTYLLSSLEDVDFDRIREDQLQSSKSGGVVYPTGSLSCELTGNGYHRDLIMQVKVQEVPLDSRIILVNNVTSDIYVDIDQVLARSEYGGPQVITSHHIDTEKPASSSSSHTLLVYSYLTNSSAEVTLPVHFRYQPPSSNSGYVSVRIPSPILMVPHPLGPASLPCHADTRDTCQWAVVTSSLNGNRVEALLTAQVPRGVEGVWSILVTASTCLVTLVAMFVLLHLIVAMAMP